MLQIVSLILIQLIHTAVSQTVLTSNVPTDPICPDTPVVFTCTIDGTSTLRWTVVNSTNTIVLVQYLGENAVLPMLPSGIVAEPNAVPVGGGLFNYQSTLSVNPASVLGDIDSITCDGGGAATEDIQTVELRSFPMAPQFTCTLPGEGMLRLNWVDTGDAVTEYQDCVCDGAACSCTPSTQCGSTSVCERNLAAGQEQTFSFTAVNCGDQESSVSTLTTAGADVPAAPVFSEVCVRYDQSTGDLMNIMATWNRMTPSDVVMGCNDEIGIQYTFTCDGSALVDLNTNCDSSTCWYMHMDNDPPSSGCTLSVAVRNAVDMTTSDITTIQGTTPLTVEVFGGIIACLSFPCCSIVYGTNENNRNLTAVSGQRISGLLPGVTYFYLVTHSIGSQVVEVEGSFVSGCDCLDLIDRQLFSPLPVCSGGGGTIPGTISNGGVTYTSLAVNSGRATYQCDSGFSVSGSNPRVCQGDSKWSGTVPTCQQQGLSVGVAVGITAVLMFLVAFSAGLLVAFVIAYCCSQRQKGQHSPGDTQQPTLTQASIPLQQGSIELKDNISYGPVTSQHPAPQQPAPMYEEVATHVQPGSMEMRANVAYGPIGH